MQSVTIDYLDGNVEDVPEQEESTLEELVALLGSLAAVITEVTSNLRYRNKYPRVYNKASKELESFLPREVKASKKMKDGTEKKILESETDHLRRCFKKDAQITTDIITKYAQSEPLWVKGERGGGGGRIGQGALDAANGFFAEGEDTVEAKTVFIEASVPGYKVGRDGDGAVTPESLARGIQAFTNHFAKIAKKQAKGTLETVTK